MRARPTSRRLQSSPVEIPSELDIRGYRVHEIPGRVTQFVDESSLHGMNTLRIIHGDGTGAIREAVRELLSRHPLVTSFKAAPKDRGGNGATLVDLT
mgnify:CR=1 FL=1